LLKIGDLLICCELASGKARKNQQGREKAFQSHVCSEDSSTEKQNGGHRGKNDHQSFE